MTKTERILTALRLTASMILLAGVVTGASFVVPSEDLVAPASAQSCPPASTFLSEFRWSSGPGGADDPATDGAKWPVGTTTKTWTNIGGSGLDVSMSINDPFDRLIDPGTGGVDLGGDIGVVDNFPTSTNEGAANDGAYGNDYLTVAIYTQSSDEIVDLDFTFNQPVFLAQGFSVDDIDSVGFGQRSTQIPMHSFQDEVGFTAANGATGVAVNATPVATGGLVQVNAGTVTANYTIGANGGLNPDDPLGQVTIDTPTPFDSFSIHYSDGPDDQAAEIADAGNPGTWDGVNNGQAVRLGGFYLCQPFDSSMTLAKGSTGGHSSGADCVAPIEVLTGLVEGEDITYCFTVTNTGAVDLDAVTFDDPVLGLAGATLAQLSGTVPITPGSSATFYYETSAPATNTTNTATAVANPVYGDGSDIPFMTESTATDTADVEVVIPAIDLQKTVYPGHTAGTGCAGAGSAEQVPNGSAITYCFTATNSGVVPLTGIGITDATLGSPAITSTIGAVGDPLLPGASVTYYYETTSSGALTNTATATGTPSDSGGVAIPGAGDVSDVDSADISPASPSVALAKTTTVGTACPGAELINPTVGTAISYCFEVTNTGDTYLVDAAISDSDIPGFAAVALVPVSGSLSLIAPGASAVVRYDTVATVDVLPNTAGVTAVPATPGGTPFGAPNVSASDTASVDVQNPAIQLIKTAVPEGSACDGIDGSTLEVATGSNVSYCFTATNTGDTELINVTIDDATLGIVALAMADISPGGSTSASHGPIAASDLVNTATASGTPAAGGVALPGAVDVADSDDAIVSALTPGVTLEKTVLAGTDVNSCPGSELVTAGNATAVVYCFEVTNSGETYLNSFAIIDPSLGITLGDMTGVGAINDPLAPGMTNTYGYLGSVAGDLLNTAGVTADPVDAGGVPVPGSTPVTDDDTAEVDEVTPAIDIVKTVYVGHDGGTSCGGANSVVTEAGAVTYCFAVTNSSSDTHLADVTVDDPTLGIAYPGALVLAAGDPTLVAPGASLSFYVESAATADLTNTASTTGTPANAGGVPVPSPAPTADDSASVDVVAPSIDLAKTGYAGHDAGASCAGNEVTAGVTNAPVTYCFAVTNTGDTHLNGITVDDVTLGISLSDPTLLAPGASVTLSYDGMITADLVNTATATGLPSGAGGATLVGITPPSDDDTAEVVLIAPAISIDKTIYNGSDLGAQCATATDVAVALSGESATYCFTVTNTGDSILSNVTIDDATLGIAINSGNAQMLSGSLVSMAPGATATLYLEALAGAADVINIASATGTPVDGVGISLPGVAPPTDADDAVLNVIAPSVTLIKTVSVDGTCPGGELAKVASGAAVTYCFDVANTGDTHMVDAVINDDIYGVLNAGNTTAVSGSLTLIAPGETATVSYTVNATVDVLNTASTSAQPAESDGTPLPATPATSGPDTAEVQIVNPSISLAKTNYSGHNAGASCQGGELVTGLAGDAVTYCFLVTNTGDVTLTALAVDDATLGINLVVPGPLAPGASATVTHETTITGDLVNSAIATGDPAEADGTPLPATSAVNSAPDTAEVVQVAPGIIIEKTVYEGHDSGASCGGIDYLAGQSGDTITYCFEVTNSGDTYLNSVTANDITLALGLPVPGPIAPGASATVFFESTMTGDLINNADATGTPSDVIGTPIVGLSPITSVLNPAEVDVVAPDISLEKTVSTTGSCPGLETVSVEAGDSLTYCFLVTNLSDVALASVTIDDPDLGISDTDMTVISGSLALMEPLDVASLSYATTATTDLLNTASATGQPAFSGTGAPLPGTVPVTDSDTANVDVVLPGLSLAKTASIDGSCAGSELVEVTTGTAVTYCFEITNTGDSHLGNVTISDDIYGSLNSGNTVAVTGSLALIAPAETVTVSYGATATSSVINTASATGQPSDPGGTPLALPSVSSADDTAEVQVIVPGITLAKTNYAGHDGGASCDGGELVTGLAGAGVTYCFTVTNSGDVDLTNVTVDDTDLGVVLNVPGPIAAGASATVFHDAVISGDLTNTATVTGTPSTSAGTPLPGTTPLTSAPDTAAVDEIGPSISLAKTNYAGNDGGTSCDGAELVTGLAGDGVTYCFTVTNTGDTNLVNIDVNDADLGITLNIVGPVAPGATATVFHDATIAGDLVNTATATGVPSDGAGVPLPGIPPALSAPDTAEVDEVAPELTVAKTVYVGHDGGASCVGSELATVANGAAVTYCFLVTNTGDVNLTSVTVDDADLGITLNSPVSLAPGETTTLHHETNATADLVNTATATGAPSTPPGVPFPTVPPVISPPDTAEVDVVNPALTVAKTVYLGHDTGASCDGAELVTGQNGDAVTYCFTVTNTGDAPLNNITVDDADLGITLPVVGPIAIGATATVFHEATITGDLVNSATATGSASTPPGVLIPGAPPVTSPPDTAEVDEVTPSISVAKTNYAGQDAGASCDGGELVEGLAGDPITYCFTITNTGDTSLANIDVNDADLGITLNIAGPVSPGATATVHYEATITGDLINTATASATATDAGGIPLPGVPAVNSGPDTAEANEINPALTVNKTVYSGHDGGASCQGAESASILTGDAVTYCFLVTNTGDVNLTSVTVDDADLGITLNSPVALAPGATTTLHHETTATADLVNTATATGTPSTPPGVPIPGVPPVTSPPDTAEVDVVSPALTVDKTIYLGHDAGASCDGTELATGQNGAAVTYCFTVTNTGDVDLTNITVDDADLGLSLPVAGPIAVGATATVHHEATITGDLVNTADATATPSDPGGTPLPGTTPVTSPPDTAEVDEVGPGLAIAKTNYAGHNAGASCDGGELVTGLTGDAVTYCFTITNTGDTSLVNIDVNDADLAITLNIAGPVAPGATATAHHEAIIAGDLVNTATASATASDVGGTPLPGVPTVNSGPDTAEVNEINPALTVDKTVYAGHNGGLSCLGADTVSVLAGDAVTYCFLATNTGDVNLTSVTVDDAELGITLNSPVALAPGATTTLFTESTATGDLVNTATATGTPSTPPGVPIPTVPPVTSPPDISTVDVVNPDLTLSKTVYAGHDTGAGCAGAGELVSDVASSPVTFCFEVTNTGDTYLDAIIIDDAAYSLVAATLPMVAGTMPLAPGASATVYLEETISADVLNTATATATPTDSGGLPLGVTEPSDTDTAEVDLIGPGLDVAKTVSIDSTCPGIELAVGETNDAITYCFVATNSGDTSLVALTLTDATLGITDADMTVVSGSLPLAPGAAITFSYTSTITADLVNTVDASAQPSDPGGTPLPGVSPVTDSDFATVQLLAPVISAAKTVSTDGTCAGSELVTVASGADVIWCLEVTNTGDTALTNVTIDDAIAGLASYVPSPGLVLLPGESLMVPVAMTATTDVTNSVTFTADPSDPAGAPLPGNLDPVTATDDAAVDVVGASIALDKTISVDGTCGASDDVTAGAGFAITYCFEATNTGDTHLANVDIVDPTLGITSGTLAPDSIIDDDNALPLSPGGTVTFHSDAVVAGSLVNVATTSGDPVDAGGVPIPGPGGLPLGPVSDDDTATLTQADPAINIVKTVYLAHDGGASCSGANTVVAPTGSLVTWCYTVTNTGSATTLAPVTLDDADLGVAYPGAIQLASGDPVSVPAGAVLEFFYETTSTGDFVNTAAATGIPVDGAGAPIPGAALPPVTDSAETVDATPAITISTTVLGGTDATGCPGTELVTGPTGTELVYCYEVTNTGDIALANVTVDDPDVVVSLTGPALLLPGQTVMLTTVSTISVDLINTATATGLPADAAGNPIAGAPSVSDSDPAEVDLVGPGLVVDKTVYLGTDAGAGCAANLTESVLANTGEDVVWCFELTNTGDTVLDNLALTDTPLGITDAAMTVLSGATPLAPGEAIPVLGHNNRQR